MKNFILVIFALLLLSCGNSTKKGNAGESDQAGSAGASGENTDFAGDYDEPVYPKIDDETVEIPFFEIEVQLSGAAEEKLKKDNESVIVAAYFSGYCEWDKIPEEYQDYFGDGDLLVHRIELTNKRIARFEHLELPQKLYDLLDDKDFRVLINIFSGRKSSESNILDCAVLSGPISKIKEKRFTLNGGLITENRKDLNGLDL